MTNFSKFRLSRESVMYPLSTYRNAVQCAAFMVILLFFKSNISSGQTASEAEGLDSSFSKKAAATELPLLLDTISDYTATLMVSREDGKLDDPVCISGITPEASDILKQLSLGNRIDGVRGGQHRVYALSTGSQFCRTGHLYVAHPGAKYVDAIRGYDALLASTTMGRSAPNIQDLLEQVPDLQSKMQALDSACEEDETSIPFFFSIVVSRPDTHSQRLVQFSNIGCIKVGDGRRARLAFPATL